jgi:hypothetical protein
LAGATSLTETAMGGKAKSKEETKSSASFAWLFIAPPFIAVSAARVSAIASSRYPAASRTIIAFASRQDFSGLCFEVITIF